MQGGLKLYKIIPAKRVNVFTTARYTNAAACTEIIVRAEQRRICCFKLCNAWKLTLPFPVNKEPEGKYGHKFDYPEVRRGSSQYAQQRSVVGTQTHRKTLLPHSFQFIANYPSSYTTALQKVST